jgi:hypothetical protein
MLSKKIKKTTSRKNILKLNLFVDSKTNKKSKKTLEPSGLSQENKFLQSKKQSRTISQLNLVDFLMSREQNKSVGRRSQRKGARKKKLTVDIAKLEHNLKSNRFNLKTNRKTGGSRSKKVKPPPSKARMKKQAKSREKKIRLSTYLKTERNSAKKNVTPRNNTQVDLRQISLRQKKKKVYKPKSKPLGLDFVNKIKKESFNSLKLLKNSKQLSQEETFLILKSLESEKILRKIKKGKDIFFLKESKIKKRNTKKSTYQKSKKTSRSKKPKVLKDINFGTRNNNLLIKNPQDQFEFNSEKKRY